MNVTDAAKQLGISPEELFTRAYKRYGLVLSPGGHQSDLGWWKKWGTEPLYVKKFIKELAHETPSQQLELPFS